MSPQPARRPRNRATLGDDFALYLVVALGAALGGSARAALSLAAISVAGDGFPWGTLVANTLGSFVICAYATLTAPDGRLLVGPRQRQFVMTGLCGGFTTFSVFSLETFRFAARGEPAMAALNVMLSLTAWLVAAWAGQALAVRINRLEGARP